MNASIQSQLAEVKTHLRTAGTAYFDPHTVLAEKLDVHPVLYAPVASSMAWMLDMLTINQARTVMYELYKERPEDDLETKLENYLQQISEDLKHESLYWSDDGDSPCSTLAMLLSLRGHWHEIAAAQAAANNRDYVTKPLSVMIAEEKPLPLRTESRDKLEKLAEMEAKGDKQKKDFMLQAMVEAHNSKAVSRIEQNKRLAEGLTEILRSAALNAGTHMRITPDKRKDVHEIYAEDEGDYSAPANDENVYVCQPTRFDQLPQRMQAQLARFTLKAINDKLADLATSRVSAMEYGMLLSAAYDIKKTLQQVLDEKFSDASELESQSSIDSNRQAKRKAWAEI